MNENVAFFIAGVAVGLAIYRWIVSVSSGKLNPTICDLCKYNRDAGKRS